MGKIQEMLRFLLIFFCLAKIASAALNNAVLDDIDPTHIHAVLLATISSENYDDPTKWSLNYAPEAEVARTYHSLRDRGVPAENIILFMNGNFANNEDNPYPGTLYTDKERSRNYAEGLPIDYSRDEVSPANYLAVLRGEKDRVKGGSGRVLNSTANDRVFVSHEGHGWDGHLLIADAGWLTKEDLNSALKHMEEKRMFKELVYFIMACRSGSMFLDMLDKNGKVYAMTAAPPLVDTICKDSMPGKGDNICINTQFGDAWMDHVEQCNTDRDTLDDQYKVVKPQVGSGPQQFGNLDIAKRPIGHFEGVCKKPNLRAQNTRISATEVQNGPRKIVGSKSKAGSRKIVGSKPKAGQRKDGLPISAMAGILVLKQKLAAKKLARAQISKPRNIRPSGSRFIQIPPDSEEQELQKRLDRIDAERGQIMKMSDVLVNFVLGDQSANMQNSSVKRNWSEPPKNIIDLKCHDRALKTIWNDCKKLRGSAYIGRVIHSLINLCNDKYSVEMIVKGIKKYCQK